MIISPFDVDVAHFLAADADIIQDDVTGVPDDATQEEPEGEAKVLTHVLVYWLLFVYYTAVEF